MRFLKWWGSSGFTVAGARRTLGTSELEICANSFEIFQVESEILKPLGRCSHQNHLRNGTDGFAHLQRRPTVMGLLGLSAPWLQSLWSKRGVLLSALQMGVGQCRFSYDPCILAKFPPGIIEAQARQKSQSHNLHFHWRENALRLEITLDSFWINRSSALA